MNQNFLQPKNPVSVSFLTLTISSIRQSWWCSSVSDDFPTGHFQKLYQWLASWLPLSGHVALFLLLMCDKEMDSMTVKLSLPIKQHISTGSGRRQDNPDQMWVDYPLLPFVRISWTVAFFRRCWVNMVTVLYSLSTIMLRNFQKSVLSKSVFPQPFLSF